MSRRQRRWIPLSVLVASAAGLVASITWALGAGWGPAGYWGPVRGGMTAMMGGPGVTEPGNGAVRDTAAAARAAGQFGQRWGLHVGEVMEFSNGF